MTGSPDEVLAARCAALELENNELRQRVRDLEREIYGAPWRAPVELGLTRSEELILAVLVGREQVSKRFLFNELYGMRLDDVPADKIFDVFVCKLRAKLKPHNLEILTHWGRGYSLSPASRARLRDWRPAGVLDPEGECVS